MRAIRKKIVTDEAHNPVAVLLEYEDWLEIERLLALRDDGKPVDLSVFSGVMQLAEDPTDYQQRVRSEWP